MPITWFGVERAHLHVLQTAPHAIALGEERLVGDDQTIRWGRAVFDSRRSSR
ncbi:hypothetical protein ACIBG0_38430 [Nocardia sp. NPDC050630]|uniref:hypothetical protein n=1 Tax=Nocardia sp. NPDC050630 TaxID=3364321 RepID=UPI0037B741FE